MLRPSVALTAAGGGFLQTSDVSKLLIAVTRPRHSPPTMSSPNLSRHRPLFVRHSGFAHGLRLEGAHDPVKLPAHHGIGVDPFPRGIPRKGRVRAGEHGSGGIFPTPQILKGRLHFMIHAPDRVPR